MCAPLRPLRGGLAEQEREARRHRIRRTRRSLRAHGALIRRDSGSSVAAVADLRAAGDLLVEENFLGVLMGAHEVNVAEKWARCDRGGTDLDRAN